VQRPQFFVTNELTVGLNIGAISRLGLDTTGEKILAAPALKVMTKQLTSVISDLTAAAIAAPFSSNSFDSDRFLDVLKLKGKDSVLGGITQYGQKFAEGMSDMLYNLVTQGYDRTTDVRKLYPTREKQEQALRSLFNFMDGAAQFVGGPTDNMGASVWIMGDEAFDTNPWMSRIKNSVKTSLYEELVLPKFLDKISFSVEAGLSIQADSLEQPGGEAEETSVDREKAIDLAVSHSMFLALYGMGIKFPEMMQPGNTDDIITAGLDRLPEAEREQAENIFQQLKNILKTEAENEFDNQNHLAQETITKISERLQQDALEKKRNPVSRHYESQERQLSRKESAESLIGNKKRKKGSRKSLRSGIARFVRQSFSRSGQAH